MLPNGNYFTEGTGYVYMLSAVVGLLHNTETKTPISGSGWSIERCGFVKADERLAHNEGKEKDVYHRRETSLHHLE